MYLSKEVLLSIEKTIIFHNINEVFNISDCTKIQQKYNKKFNDNDCIYWLDSNNIKKSDFKDINGIILLNKKDLSSNLGNEKSLLKIIFSEEPKKLYDEIINFLHNETIIYEIHNTAIVKPGVKLGENVSIGAFTIIEEGCIIGNNCVIFDNCSIGKNIVIEESTIIYSGTRIGFNVFGFKKNSLGVLMKFQQIGAVHIGKKVTIGSNTCINNGFLTDTIINDNVFIDSLCQIGESVIIGENTIIAANSFIATNTYIGDNCWISPNVSIMENIKITNDVFIGIGSVILRNINKPCRVFGSPAKLMDF